MTTVRDANMQLLKLKSQKQSVPAQSLPHTFGAQAHCWSAVASTMPSGCITPHCWTQAMSAQVLAQFRSATHSGLKLQFWASVWQAVSRQVLCAQAGQLPTLQPLSAQVPRSHTLEQHSLASEHASPSILQLSQVGGSP